MMVEIPSWTSTLVQHEIKLPNTCKTFTRVQNILKSYYIKLLLKCILTTIRLAQLIAVHWNPLVSPLQPLWEGHGPPARKLLQEKGPVHKDI